MPLTHLAHRLLPAVAGEYGGRALRRDTGKKPANAGRVVYGMVRPLDTVGTGCMHDTDGAVEMFLLVGKTPRTLHGMEEKDEIAVGKFKRETRQWERVEGSVCHVVTAGRGGMRIPAHGGEH
eukprot:3933666-Rhodomonas_salina.2